MQLYWTSKKAINGLKHFVIINQYELNEEIYLDFVSVLDDAIHFSISKKVFEESRQWIKGWKDNEKEKINIKQYLKFISEEEYKSHKINLSETSSFYIS